MTAHKERAENIKKKILMKESQASFFLFLFFYKSLKLASEQNYYLLRVAKGIKTSNFPYQGVRHTWT